MGHLQISFGLELHEPRQASLRHEHFLARIRRVPFEQLRQLHFRFDDQFDFVIVYFIYILLSLIFQISHL